MARSVSLTFDGPVDWAGFGIWLSMLLYARGGSVLRVKGLLDVGGTGPVVLNGVGSTIHPTPTSAPGQTGDRRSRIAFAARGTGPGEAIAPLGAFETVLGARPRPLAGTRIDERSRVVRE